MSRAALLFPAIPFLMAQAPGTTPAQPFPNHEEPPSGWWCTPADHEHPPDVEAHACDCRGMMEQDPICTTRTEDEDGNQVDTPVAENAKCKVYCHKDHCLCAVRCHDSN